MQTGKAPSRPRSGGGAPWRCATELGNGATELEAPHAVAFRCSTRSVGRSICGLVGVWVGGWVGRSVSCMASQNCRHILVASVGRAGARRVGLGLHTPSTWGRTSGYHSSGAGPRWGAPRASLRPHPAPGGDIKVMPEVRLTPYRVRATVPLTWIGRCVAATDGQIPKLFVATTKGPIIRPTDPQPSRQQHTRPPWPPGTPTPSATTHTSS